MFVCASSVINGFTGGDPKFTAPTAGNSYLGGATTFTRVARTGIIAAVDVTTNTLAWRYQWPEQCYSGTTATAGGLLFVGRSDGRLTALDSTTGKQLWEFQTGAGMHAPVSVFEHKGKQYVLAFSAGAALLGSARGDSVWLFGLDGTMPPVSAGTPVSRQVAIAAGTPNVVAGKALYQQACEVCHEADGRGGHGAAASLVALKDLTATIQTVTTGRNTMPSFSANFTPEQIRDVSGYVVQVLAR
jgi:mono/diheme cytochrome c family protein